VSGLASRSAAWPRQAALSAASRTACVLVVACEQGARAGRSRRVCEPETEHHRAARTRAFRSRRARRSTSRRRSRRSPPAISGDGRGLAARRSSDGDGQFEHVAVAVVREGMKMSPRRSPEHRDERSLLEPRGIWPTMVIPLPCSLVAVTRPHAPEQLDRERVQEGELVGPEDTMSRPFGGTALATLARNFVLAMPTVIGRPTCSRTLASAGASQSRWASRPAASSPNVEGTPRRSRALRRVGSCHRTARTRPCSPLSTPTFAAEPRSPEGITAEPANRPSRCGRHTPSPRSSLRGRPLRRR
jgi:hypothetical protein